MAGATFGDVGVSLFAAGMTSQHLSPHRHTTETQPATTKTPPPAGTAEGQGWCTQKPRFEHRIGWSSFAHSTGAFFLWRKVFSLLKLPPPACSALLVFSVFFRAWVRVGQNVCCYGGAGIVYLFMDTVILPIQFVNQDFLYEFSWLGASWQK